jgi:2,4-diketo-3-deoxy-L-fuconate hydrolase
MKLIRWGNPGKEKTGVIIGEKRLDTSAFGEDYNEIFFESDGLVRLQKFVAENEGKLPAVADGERWGSPIARPSKLICIGLNYADQPAP